MDKISFPDCVFHCTPQWNFTPILKQGVDPAYSRGQLPFSWWVEHDRVEWAIKHIADKYDCPVPEVIVFSVEEVIPAFFFNSPQIGVYRSGKVLRPTACFPSYNWFPVEK